MVVPNMIAVEITLRPTAAQIPCRHPNLALIRPTNEERNVTIAIEEEINF
jgi:hypothetical protein